MAPVPGGTPACSCSMPKNEAHPTALESETQSDAEKAVASSEPERSSSRRAPLAVYAAAVTAALLHSLPFLRTRLGAPAPGQSWVGVPFIPPDWLAYIALIREKPRAGQVLLANPFTTDAQDGRLVLLLHHALSWAHRATGIDPAWLLEVSRAALIVAFALTLFRFLEGVLDSRTRVWAVVLTLLSGGLDFVALSATRWLPPDMAGVIEAGLWSMHGWTTFQALYNPLWAAGLVLLLLGLRPLLQPGGPTSRRDFVQAGAALLVAYVVHPYSAIAMLAIVLSAAAGEWIVSGRFALRTAGRVAAAVMPSLLAIGLIALWQLADPVVRRTSGGALGVKAIPAFWYPIAWAAVALFALKGWRAWIAAQHPWRYAIGGWFVGIALLHSSPVLNGVHFVAYAYLPVAIFAAGPLARAFAGLRRMGVVALAVLVFSGTAATAARAFTEVEQFQIPRDHEAVLASLARLPPGNVLCDAAFGNVVPAYGPHRVYVGHWFMTPEYEVRALRVAAAFERPPGDVREIVEEARIDYVVAPIGAAQRIFAALGDYAPKFEVHGEVVLLRLSRP